MIKPFFNRLGGKSRQLKYILPLLPSSIETYIEPFFGAGWVYINYNSAKKYIINDYDIEIYKMLLAIKDGNLDKLMKYDWKKNEKTFYKIKKMYKDKDTLLNRDNYEVLYFYRYLNYYGVLGDFETFNKTVPKKEIPPLERYLQSSLKLNKSTYIFNTDYKEIIFKYDSKSSFFYLDPPYLYNPNNDRYKKNEIDINEFINIIIKIKGNVLISLSSKSINKKIIKILEEYGYNYKNVILKYSSDNLQKYKKTKKVKNTNEYLFYRNSSIYKYKNVKNENQLLLFDYV